MDPEPSSSEKKVSLLEFDEKVAETLIEIGRSSETLEEFSLRCQETLPNVPVKNPHSIFNAIRRQYRSESDPDPDSSSTESKGEDRTKGWLARTAADRTALMKNLPPETDPQVNQFPIFNSEETFFLSPIESRAVVVYSNEARLLRYFDEGEIELWSARKAKRDSSCGTGPRNCLDDQSLLRRIVDDGEDLCDCSALVVDQRTAITELLFGLLKNLLLERPDLLVIFDSSAVIWDTDKLSRFFSELIVLNLHRDIFPVRLLHLEYPIGDYLSAAAFLTVQIHMHEGPAGDIIVFLAGEDEIDPVHLLITKRLSLIQGDVKAPELVVFSVYHRQGRNDPRLLVSEPKLYPPANTRRVFLTTDHGGAPFDFDNVLFSIDCGFETRVSENPRLQTNSLEVAPISRDLAARRAAWAGRAGPGGACYRLYTEAAFLEEMGINTLPENLRANLAEAFLRKQALGIRIRFLDRPSMESLVAGNRQLYCLGAVGDDLKITSLGREMVEFPVGPVHSRILVASIVDFRCSEEALTVVAMVLTGNVFERPEEEERVTEADLKRVGFFRPEGDHLTLVEIFEAWRKSQFSSRWCSDNFILYRPMNRAREIRNQLISTMNRLKFEIVSCEKDYTKITKAIASGLFFHAAKRDPKGECYRAVADDRRVHINSRSALFQGQPSCVVFEDAHVTNDGKEHMIGVTAVDPEWLLELAPRYFEEAGPRSTLMSQHEKRGRNGPDADLCNEPKREKWSA